MKQKRFTFWYEMNEESLSTHIIIFSIPLAFLLGYVGLKYFNSNDGKECILLLRPKIVSINELYGLPAYDSAEPTFNGFKIEYEYKINGKMCKKVAQLYNLEGYKILDEIEDNDGQNLWVCYNPNSITKARLVIRNRQ